MKRWPRPSAQHHWVASIVPVGLPLTVLAASSRHDFAVSVLVVTTAHVVLVGNVWLALPRPTAAISRTMLGVALESIRRTAVPLALFGITSVVAAYVGAMVGEKPDLAASFSIVGWFLGAAALAIVLAAVPYVFWRARSLSGKQLRRGRRALAVPISNPFKPNPGTDDPDALATRPVGEYALWLSTSAGGRNLMWVALLAGAFALRAVTAGPAN